LEFFDKIKLFCRGGPLCEKTKLAPSTNNQLDNILDISAEKRDLQK
jgi:hypothetical protein